MKINNTEAIKQIGMSADTYYKLIKKYPRLKLLCMKGLVSQKIINADVLDDLIKIKKEEI